MPSAVRGSCDGPFFSARRARVLLVKDPSGRRDGAAQRATRLRVKEDRRTGDGANSRTRSRSPCNRGRTAKGGVEMAGRGDEDVCYALRDPGQGNEEGLEYVVYEAAAGMNAWKKHGGSEGCGEETGWSAGTPSSRLGWAVGDWPPCRPISMRFKNNNHGRAHSLIV
ncbi:hypothetical protein CC78DRAFT_586100 [Lojkania enalia]|uniref:Uncharacterized protein n=1 Tax=Lojkania enalia TaxID=147567 RepID=A0A9P4JZ79_9PLEO|nr:hypothetical protein CC78DRAFT_586100 [Didymosphaeria enalia]